MLKYLPQLFSLLFINDGSNDYSIIITFNLFHYCFFHSYLSFDNLIFYFTYSNLFWIFVSSWYVLNINFGSSFKYIKRNFNYVVKLLIQTCFFVFWITQFRLFLCPLKGRRAKNDWKGKERKKHKMGYFKLE